MDVKEKTAEKRIIDRIIYTDQMPESLVARLSGKQRTQYFIWEEIVRRGICLHPRLLLPLLKELFLTEYSPVAECRLLPMEYAATRFEQKGKLRYSIYANLTVRVDHKGTYHLGCRIKAEGMLLQIYEYDAQIALTYGMKRMQNAEGKEERFFEFPKSVILSLSHNEDTPDEKCTALRLPNGTEYQCRTPVVKIQNYTLSDIREKQLYLLLPLLPIRFRKPFQKPGRVQARKNLTAFLEEGMMVLKEAEEREELGREERRDLTVLMLRSCRYLFADDEEFLREAEALLRPGADGPAEETGNYF